MIFDGKSELIEHAADARGPQRVGPHQRAGLRGADLDGDAEQGDARLVQNVAEFRGMRRDDLQGELERCTAQGALPTLCSPYALK